MAPVVGFVSGKKTCKSVHPCDENIGAVWRHGANANAQIAFTQRANVLKRNPCDEFFGIHRWLEHQKSEAKGENKSTSHAIAHLGGYQNTSPKESSPQSRPR